MHIRAYDLVPLLLIVSCLRVSRGRGRGQIVVGESRYEEVFTPGRHALQPSSRLAVSHKRATTLPGFRMPAEGPKMMARWRRLSRRNARSSRVVALDGPELAERVNAGRMYSLLEYVDLMINELPLKPPLDELETGAEVLDDLVEGLRKAGIHPPDDILRDRSRTNMRSALEKWQECTPESCEIDEEPGELSKSLQRLGINPPPLVLTDIARALRASGVAPPEGVLRELATAFLVEELVLRDLMKGLVVNAVDTATYETKFPEGVMLPASWPAQVERQLFHDLEFALRNNGVARWEADAILLALRGETSPDRVLRDLRWALYGARLQLNQPLLRELARALHTAGVQPCDPLVYDLAATLRTIEAMVNEDSQVSVQPKKAWIAVTEEARRLSSEDTDAWRIAARRIREVTDGCIDECDLADAYIAQLAV